MYRLKKDTCGKFESRLPRYSPLSIFIRFMIASLIALSIIYFSRSFTENVERSPDFIDYLVAILSFYIMIELNILLDIFLERLFPVPRKIALRFLFQLIGGISFMIIHVSVLSHVERYQQYFMEPGMKVSTTLGFFIIIMMSISFIAARIFEEYLFMQTEMEELKAEKLKSDYNALQDQLNPHYLFNNLSVLKSLIVYDQKAALTFTQNFTDVYRYVLKSKDKMTVSLNDELDFMGSYIGMHQERLGEGLIVKLDVDKKSIAKTLPPLTLQLLIENAIKHNMASVATPLKIEIKITPDYLIVKNNLQPRDSSYSTKTGLKNLISRYKMLTDNEFTVSKTEKSFKVRVPLL